MTAAELVRRIEHAVLGPQATSADVEQAVRLARRWSVRALVVKPCHVPVAARGLEGTSVLVVTVVGFPHGGQTTETKVAETRQAIAMGAAEVDMVMNIGALRERDLTRVLCDIRAVVDAAAGRPVKVILETGYLTDAEKRLGARLSVRAGAAFVKTSTGFGPAGATPADVALLRRILPPSVGVKAAGGIRSYRDALALLEAGADLVGTSATEAILQEASAAVA
jgi:deoxyribose-phosphate aldolase